MLQVKTKINNDFGKRKPAGRKTAHAPAVEGPAGTEQPGVHRPLGATPYPQRKSSRPIFPATRPTAEREFQTKVPVVTGEATYRGLIAVDGAISGQLGNNGGVLNVRQRSRPFFGDDPELSGELCFRDMLRVNGHIAGSVCSKNGTLIVDAQAQVDANVDVAVAVIGGIVNGDILAHQRVEVGPTAKIYGNIWTRSLAIQLGAVFEGVCRMLEDREQSK